MESRLIHTPWIMPYQCQSQWRPFVQKSLSTTSPTATATATTTTLKLGGRPCSSRSNSQSPSSQGTASFSSASFSSSSNNNEGGNTLSSSRGRNAVSLLPVYLSDARAVTKYHPVHAPDGALQLSVAENQMLEDLLVPAIQKFSSAFQHHDQIDDDNHDKHDDDFIGGFFHSDQIYYQQTHGRAGLRQAMGNYLQRILKLSTSTTLTDKTLDVDGIVMGAGCNAVLENLCFCLTEPGDAVLLPTPYYAAFEFDLVARAGLNIVPVHTRTFHSRGNNNEEEEEEGENAAFYYYPNRASLDAAYDCALEKGSQPKILLLSHPNNPLGICYPPSVILECIQWAREKLVHLVSDEIYAGSVYQSNHPETGEETFQSVLKLAATSSESSADTHHHGKGLGLGPFVHFVYALSKDFALSGLRVGVAYSENEEIRVPMQKLNDLCQISSQTQVTIEEMLSSPHRGQSDGGNTTYGTFGSKLWSTDSFLPENHKRIKERSQTLQNVLQECQIPFLKGDSGLFLWMDLSEFLPELPKGEASGLAESQESMDARERVLYLELMKEFGLLFTPGRSMRNELPGFFRCVFTAASEAEFALALERIKCFVTAKRK